MIQLSFAKAYVLSIFFWSIFTVVHVHSKENEKDQQLFKLKTLLDEALKDTLKAVKTLNKHEFNDNQQVLGHGLVQCINHLGEILYLNEFGIQTNQAVSLRSLSKIIVAATIMAMNDTGLINVNDTVGEKICPNSKFENVKLVELLSMSSFIMDSRANAFRAAQLKRKNSTIQTDFVGFPPLCDELKLTPYKCVTEYICPLFREEESSFELAGVTKNEFIKAPDVTCGPFIPVEKRKLCLQRATKGFCSLHPAYMADECFFACHESGCERSENYKERSLDNSTQVRWVYEYDRDRDKIVKKRTYFVYDNYGYTVADAYVYALHGKHIADFATELIFERLGMRQAIECLKPANNKCDDTCQVAEIECLKPPGNLHEWHQGKFQQWTEGQMSPAWVSNTFFASAEDISKFIQALLRNGTTDDAKLRILSQRSVDFIFSHHIVPPRPFGACVGTQAWGLGMGYCFAKETNTPYQNQYKSKVSNVHPSRVGVSMCTSENSWTWGGSHGSRISLLRDKNVGCFTIANSPCYGTFATRAHFIGHNMSAIMRDVFIEGY
jgi:CubicO group peptidase (beta-lactamase class C family)